MTKINEGKYFLNGRILRVLTINVSFSCQENKIHLFLIIMRDYTNYLPVLLI